MSLLRCLGSQPLLTHKRTDVSAVLQYMTSMREADDSYMHIRVCRVALHLAAALPEDQLTHVREQLREMFEALPAPETFARYVKVDELLMFLQSVVQLARRDMGLVGSGAVARLKDALAQSLQSANSDYSAEYLMQYDKDIKQITADLETLHQDVLKQ